MQERARRRCWHVTDRMTGDVLEIAGLEWGRGEPTTLLLHANGFCAATWDEVAGVLAERGRVVALDARGHGASSAPAAPEAYDWQNLVADVYQVAAALLAESGVHRVALCAGSSLGGVIGAALAGEHPELFGRVVMLDPPLVPNAETRRQLQLPAPGGALGIAEQARRRRDRWASRAEAAASWRGKPTFARWSQRAFERYVECGLRDCDDGSVVLCCRPDVEAAIFEKTDTIDLFERAGRIDVPVHIVRAGGGYFPLGLYEALAAKMRRARVSVMDGGHLLPMEAPLEVAHLLERERDAAREQGGGDGNQHVM